MKFMSLPVAVMAALTLVGHSGSHAQSFPSRLVKIVVPFAPGGSTDVGARIINTRLAALWGQPVLVENRAGANTVIGTEAVAKAAPDGYTILMTSTAMVVNPTVVAKLPYDTVNDFIPITTVSASPFAIVASNNFSAKSIKEVIDIDRAKPGSLAFGATDSSASLVGALFNTIAKTSLEPIPYKGAGPMMIDLAGGHTPLAIAAVSSVQAQVRAGRAHILAIASDKPSPAFPDAPAVATGEFAEFNVATWFALFAPKGTPMSIIHKIQHDVAMVLNEPDVKARFVELGADIGGQSPEDFSAQVTRELALWARVGKAANIKPN